MTLAQQNIRHKGIFSLSDLLQSISTWLKDHNYDFHARKHKQKEFTVKLRYDGELNVNEYVKFFLTVDVEIFDYKEIEIIKNGKKQKANQGVVNIFVICKYELDYQERFGKSKFLQKVKDFYHKYVLKRTIEDVWEDMLIMHFSQLAGAIKKSLEHEIS